ncbi:MAG: hypothetical protein AAF683_00015 [Pseudomonadota bacterium]
MQGATLNETSTAVLDDKPKRQTFANRAKTYYILAMKVNSDKSLKTAKKTFERFGRSWTEMRRHAVRRDGVLVVNSAKAPARAEAAQAAD